MTIIEINHAVSIFLYDIASTNIWTESIAILLSDGILILALISYVIFMLPLRKKGIYIRTLFQDISPALITTAAVVVMKYFIDRDRPFLELGLTPFVSQPDPHSSFPSFHAAVFSAFAVTLLIHHRKFGIFLVSLLPLVMIGRIAIGVHWLTDVAAGVLMGTMISLRFYFKNYKSKILAEKMVNKYLSYRNKKAKK